MLIIPAEIKSPQGLADRSFKFTVHTPELNPQTLAELFSYNGEFCYVAIKKEGFIQADKDIIKDLKADFPGMKTPSQRLRNIIFRLWEVDNKGFDNFDSYYINRMEGLMNQMKNELDFIKT